MIQEDYVSFEVAKLLNEKCFEAEGFWFYNENGVKHFVVDKDDENWGEWDGDILCPTQSLAMKWLREMHGISIEISSSCQLSKSGKQMWKGWAARRIILSRVIGSVFLIGRYDTYEKACDEAIKYCLNNLNVGV